MVTPTELRGMAKVLWPLGTITIIYADRRCHRCLTVSSVFGAVLAGLAVKVTTTNPHWRECRLRVESGRAASHARPRSSPLSPLAWAARLDVPPAVEVALDDADCHPERCLDPFHLGYALGRVALQGQPLSAAFACRLCRPARFEWVTAARAGPLHYHDHLQNRLLNRL